MRNYKLAKTAVALILGASVVTSVVPATDTSAASKYKIKSGKLVVAKTGKVASGYVTYKKVLYKSGKKFTGLKSKIYYKSGKKSTGVYKGAYYINGVKKVTTGTYNKAYYVKGVKKVTTGLYASKYYKEGKLGTGTYKAAYYQNGVKKATTGYYSGAYYVKGVKKVTTGIYQEKYYVKGKLSVGLAIYKKQLYNNGSLNKDLVLYNGELYDGPTLNKGIKTYKDATGLELFYNNTELANGTFFVDGTEEAFENGVKVGAKVSSIEAINGITMEVKFNKAVDKVDAESDLVKTAIKVSSASVSSTSLSEDGRTLIITFNTTLDLKEATVEIPAIKTKADLNVSTPKYLKVVTYKDTVAPTVVSATAAIAKINDTTTNKVTVTFSEPVQSTAIAYVNDTNVAVSQGDNKNELILTLGMGANVGDKLNIKLSNVKDLSGNAIEPNPADISTVVVAADSTAPVMQSITTKSVATELYVTFSFDKKVIASTIETSKTYVSANGINVGKVENAVISADGKSVTYKVTLTDLTALAAFEKDGKFTADLYVQEALVTDEAGNKSAATNQPITFTKDTIAPVLLSSELKNNELVLNFNEEVKVDDAKNEVKVVFYNAQTGYEKEENAVKLSVANLSNGGKTLTINLGVTVDNVDKTYKVSFVKGTIKDSSNNEFAAYNETIIVKKSEAATTKDTVHPSVNFNDITDQLVGKNYELKFTVKDEVLGTGETHSGVDFASILNTGNYTIAGLALPRGSKITTDVLDVNAFSKNGVVNVTITIPKTAIKTNLDGKLTVVGLKDRNGNTLVEVKNSIDLNLKEGEAPTLTTAGIGSDNNLIIGFSEAIKHDIPIEPTNGPKAVDFTIKLNGKKVTPLTFTKGTGTDAGKYLVDLQSKVKIGVDAVAAKVEIGGTESDKVKQVPIEQSKIETSDLITYTVNTEGTAFKPIAGIEVPIISTENEATIEQGGMTFKATKLAADDEFTVKTTKAVQALESYFDVDGDGAFNETVDILLRLGALPKDYSLSNSSVIASITIETNTSITEDLKTTDENGNPLTQGEKLIIK